MAFDFPNTPTVGQVYSGYVWDSEKWLTQPAKGSKKNYIINGAMMVAQEFGTGGTSVHGQYGIDMWFLGSTGPSCSMFQGSGPTPSGSPYYMTYSVTTGKPSLAAGDSAQAQTCVEGFGLRT